jgi:hypothetical protein
MTSSIAYPTSIGLLLIHAACFGVVWTGVTWRGQRAFAQTPSFEEIAVRAWEQLLEFVYARLSGAESSPQSQP